MGTRLSQEDSKGAELTPRFVACAFGTSVAARNQHTAMTDDVLRVATLTVDAAVRPMLKAAVAVIASICVPGMSAVRATMGDRSLTYVNRTPALRRSTSGSRGISSPPFASAPSVAAVYRPALPGVSQLPRTSVAHSLPQRQGVFS